MSPLAVPPTCECECGCAAVGRVGNALLTRPTGLKCLWCCKNHPALEPT